MFGRFLKDRRGGVAPMVAMAALPLLGSVGVAVDYSKASAARTAIQAAIDSTALMIAKQNSSSSQLAGQAQEIFSALFSRTDVENIAFNTNATNVGGGRSVELSASAVVKTAFLGPLGFPTIKVDVHATAFSNNDGLGCVLALSQTAGGAFSASGNANVELKGCSLYDNSNSATAFSVNGSATLTALSIGVVGKSSISHANVTTTQGINTGLSPIADPYADVSIPAFSGCNQNNYTAKTTVTIDPGVYCNGLSANAGAELTLNPGVYIIDRGSFAINGGATVTGQGVTLVFTSSTGGDFADAKINGGATINLTPPELWTDSRYRHAGRPADADRYRVQIQRRFDANSERRSLFTGWRHQLFRRRKHQHELHADHRRYRQLYRQLEHRDQLQRLQGAAFQRQRRADLFLIQTSFSEIPRQVLVKLYCAPQRFLQTPTAYWEHYCQAFSASFG